LTTLAFISRNTRPLTMIHHNIFDSLIKHGCALI